MAQVRILELCLLLLLNSPISLECDDCIFVDSRLFLGLSHARNGNAVCTRQQKMSESRREEDICADAAPYQCFSTQHGSKSCFDCTVGQGEGRVCEGSSMLDMLTIEV
jgi:hypothetical protein